MGAPYVIYPIVQEPVVESPEPEAITADKWHPATNQPLFDVPHLEYVLAPHVQEPVVESPEPEAITADKWHPATNQPLFDVPHLEYVLAPHVQEPVTESSEPVSAAMAWYTETNQPPGLLLAPYSPAAQSVTIEVFSTPPLTPEAPGESEPGPTVAFVHKPDFTTPAGLSGPVRVLNWRTSRSLNKIGTWEVELAVDDQPIAGAPVHLQIRKGWHLSLIQEGNIPEERVLLPDEDEGYLLYLGVVESREYRIGAASATLVLRGLMRTAHLGDRMIWSGYSATAYGAAFEDLVSDDDYIGPGGGVIYPPQYSGLAVQATLNEQSRYAAVLKLAEMGRLALRESWNKDRPELVRIDGPAYSGYVFGNVEAFDPAMADQGSHGMGYIAGTPAIRYEGVKVINRIVPIGADFDGSDLTLEHATLTSPYVVHNASNPDGTNRFYVEDTESQTAYGVVEAQLLRTDVKNPSDDAATRTAAANVLYALAAGTLLKHKSEVIEVKLAIANGADVWALPGDTVVLQHTGWVVDEAGDQGAWLEVNRLFQLTQRDDVSDPSGVRQVSFTIAAPEIEIEVPDLPEAIPALPDHTTGLSFPSFAVPDLLGAGGLLDGLGALAAGEVVDCCDDATADLEEGAVLPIETDGTADGGPVVTTDGPNYILLAVPTVSDVEPNAEWAAPSGNNEIGRFATPPNQVGNFWTPVVEGWGLFANTNGESGPPPNPITAVDNKQTLFFCCQYLAAGTPSLPVLTHIPGESSTGTVVASVLSDADHRLTLINIPVNSNTTIDYGTVDQVTWGQETSTPARTFTFEEVTTRTGAGSSAKIGSMEASWSGIENWAAITVRLRVPGAEREGTFSVTAVADADFEGTSARSGTLEVTAVAEASFTGEAGA